jgi:CIC family chloride channel protein
MVIVSEMTGNYDLLLPTLWVCAIAFLLSDEQSIYSSQVDSRSRSPAHQGDYVREVLTGLQVSQFVFPHQVPVVHPEDRLEHVLATMTSGSCNALPVTDSEGRLLGVLSLEEVHLAAQSPHSRAMILAADLMRTDVEALHMEDRVDRALELFVENDLTALPVIDGTGDRKVLGLVQRSDISAAYLRHVHGLVEERLSATVTTK